MWAPSIECFMTCNQLLCHIGESVFLWRACMCIFYDFSSSDLVECHPVNMRLAEALSMQMHHHSSVACILRHWVAVFIVPCLLLMIGLWEKLTNKRLMTLCTWHRPWWSLTALSFCITLQNSTIFTQISSWFIDLLCTSSVTLLWKLKHL